MRQRPDNGCAAGVLRIRVKSLISSPTPDNSGCRVYRVGSDIVLHDTFNSNSTSALQTAQFRDQILVVAVGTAAPADIYLEGQPRRHHVGEQSNQGVDCALGQQLPADRLHMDDMVETRNREQLLKQRIAQMRDLLDAVAGKDDGLFAGSKLRQIR